MQRLSGIALLAAAVTGGTTLAAEPTTAAPLSQLTADLARCEEPLPANVLCYSASKLELETEPNHIVWHDFEFIDTTRGTTRVKADLSEATGADLANSTWVLTGHVQVFMPQGQLSADAATVRIVDKHIVSMSAEGAPALFERVAKAGADSGAEVDHGHARKIIYDKEHDTLQLGGDAWLSVGCSEISSEQLRYDILSGRVDADPGDGKRVQGTFHSRSSAQCAPGAPRP
jgi:lipopolysaccharide transport protein LptA